MKKAELLAEEDVIRKDCPCQFVDMDSLFDAIAIVDTGSDIL